MPLQTIVEKCGALVSLVGRSLPGTRRLPRAQLYGVGACKSGTHSIAAMFEKSVRAKHEPQAAELIQKIRAAAAAHISRQELAAWVRARTARLALAVDSSQLNFFILDVLLQEFPAARFLLTIRDPYSWLDSLANHSLRHAETNPGWMAMRDFRFRPGLVHAPEERALKEKKLYTLDGYLSYWAMHNGRTIAQVPAARLMVVRTDEITRRAYEIADFAGLPRRAVRLDRTHTFQNPVKSNLLRQIDRGFLEAKMEKHCRPLLARFFPEIKSLADVKL